jgi:hypothetical protein
VEVAKVKKRAGLTGVRNVKGDRPAAKRATGSKAAAKRPKAKAASVNAASARKARTARTAAKTAKNAKTKNVKTKIVKKAKTGARLSLVKSRPEPTVRVAVRALDPHRKCGPGTSVQALYRVDETVDGRSTPHLVFFDRHGWYCEHGRTCPAVGHAKKYDGQIARVS